MPIVSGLGKLVSFHFVKLLFVAIIALVIPLFFVLVFVMSTVNKLANLRDRCRDARQRLSTNTNSTPATPGASQPDADLKAREDYHLTVEQYNRARRQFPSSLLARLWGFREPEPVPLQPDGNRRTVQR